jgi:hypothetical protein
MTATTLMQDVKTITEAANVLAVITSARAAFKEQLKEVSVSPATKMQAIAQFEKECAFGILDKAFASAMELELKNAQTQAALAQAAAANAQAEGFDHNLRVQAGNVYVQYAGLAANNNIMTAAIAKNVENVVKKIYDRNHTFTWLPA